jgi:hypothetical protein
LAKITLKLRGGLGNQLFQYSAGAYFAQKLGAKLEIDDSSIYRHADRTRTSWLKEIDYINTFHFSNVSWITPSKRLHLRTIGRVRPKKIYYDESNLKSIEKLTNDIFVYDWFYEKKYVEHLHNFFSDNKHKQRRLRLRNPAIRENVSIQKRIAALHMRLGDFKKTHWGILPSEWYLARVKDLNALGVEEIHCYSDDLIESRSIVENWNLEFNFHFPEESKRYDPHELLHALTRYQIVISSNSSLCWWSSYFNQNKNPIILCSWNQNLRLEHWRYYEQ